MYTFESMKLNELRQSHEKLKGLTDQQIEGILELIDFKTEDDMEKALQKMESMKNDLIKWVVATIIATSGLILAVVKILS
jgi:tRNA U34 5-carboxymethylaminomethyl modifying GTPase MnmE/TrmE